MEDEALVEKGTVVGGTAVPALEADVMGHEAAKTAHALDIAPDRATDLDREIDPVLKNAGRGHLEEGKDEAIAVNIVAAEPVAGVVTVEMTTAPAAAARPSVVVEAVEVVGVTAVATSLLSRDVVRVRHPGTTATETVVPQESAKAINGAGRTNSQHLQGHPWVHRLLGSMIDEVTMLDLVLTIVTVIVIGILAASNQMLDEDQSRTVVIGMMIEKDR